MPSLRRFFLLPVAGAPGFSTTRMAESPGYFGRCAMEGCSLKDSRLGSHPPRVRQSAPGATGHRGLGLLVVILFLVGCGGVSPDLGSRRAVFEEIAVRADLDFVHVNGMSGEYYYLEIMGAGAALFDYDGDGDLDLYLVQGHALGEGIEPRHGPPFRDRLFRNELEESGALRFTDVTAESGIDAAGYGMGVAVGDYTNDGCPDVHVQNWGRNQLWRNRCDGTFEEVTEQAGVQDDHWSVGATFFDYDRDGWLDLYVANYKSYSLSDELPCFNRHKQRQYCGPVNFESVADRLFHNKGDGTFEDVSDGSLIGNRVGAGLGVVASDLDGDGWLDLYVTNDQEPNFQWRNRTDGTFQDVAALTGTSVDGRGMALASMGVDAADFDGDGLPDLFMTHLRGEPSILYRNVADGLFEDASGRTRIGDLSWDSTGFGTLFFDYDNDGFLDLFVANGAILPAPELRRRGDPQPLREPNQLFRNLGSAKFADVSKEAGAPFALSEVSRGAAFGDIDNDGDTDVIVTNNGGRVRLLENRAGATRPWLGLQLVTGAPARPAHGARLRVERRGAGPLWRQVRIDGSYASANDARVLVGLGEASEVVGVHVEWPDGTVERFAAPPTNRYSLLKHGEGSQEVDRGRAR